MTRKTKTDFTEDVISSVQNKFGKSAALRLKDHEFLASVRGGISTQCLALDIAIGRPGIPLGRVTEISGLESHGKSSLGIHLIAEAQRRGGVAILSDNESGYEPDHAIAMGVDPESLIVIQPECMEDVFTMAAHAIKNVPKDVSPVLFVWDSVAGTPARQEVEGKFDDRHFAPHARIIGQGLRKLVPVIADRGVAFVCINQLRDNINTLGYGAERYKTFGGHALRFHSTVRLVIRRMRTEKKNNVPVGIWCVVKVSKNKVAPPYREAKLFLSFAKGIDRLRDLIDLGIEYKILGTGNRKGSVSYDGETCLISNAKEKLLPLLGGAKELKRMILREAKRRGLIERY
jgi:recombination protein RecA